MAPEPTPYTQDKLATCTQLEADIALCEWRRQRHLPPALRIVGNDPALAAYEATLDVVRDVFGCREVA